MGGGITGSKGNPQSNKNLEAQSKWMIDIMKPLLGQSQGQVYNMMNQGRGNFENTQPIKVGSPGDARDPNSFRAGADNYDWRTGQGSEGLRTLGDNYDWRTGQGSEALRTGAANAYVPSIARATEASARAGAQATQGTRDDLTRQGVTGTDYDRLMSQAMQTANYNTSQAAAPLYKEQADRAATYQYGRAGAEDAYRYARTGQENTYQLGRAAAEDQYRYGRTGMEDQYLYNQATANQGFNRDIVGAFYKALTGAPQVGISGLGTSATNATNVNTGNSRDATELMSSAAKAAAAAACWIAARLYGRGSLNFYLARYWIMQVWQGRLADLTRRLYVRYGEHLSRHPWLVRCLKPCFDYAASQGRRATYRGE